MWPDARIQGSGEGLEKGHACTNQAPPSEAARPRSAAITIVAHPARNAAPPNGVTITKTFMPVRAKTYRLPLNSATPTKNSQPDRVINL